MTKRKIKWVFGFPNAAALEAGETGMACRGEEHEVVIIWSVTSGKKVIHMDTEEIFHEVNRSGTLEYNWTIKNHVLRLFAQATPPMSGDGRQYDLFIDGQSFFSMPKVYELGLKGPITAHDRIPGVMTNAHDAPPTRQYDVTRGEYVSTGPRNVHEEEADLKRAIAASLNESKRHLGTSGNPIQAPAPAPKEELLIDFFSEPAPAPTAPPAVAPPAPAATYPTQPVPPSTYGSPTSPVPQTAVPAPYGVPAAHDPFAPKPPTYNDISSQIMQGYGGTTAPPSTNTTNAVVPTQAPGAPFAPPPVAASSNSMQGSYVQGGQSVASGSVLSNPFDDGSVASPTDAAPVSNVAPAQTYAVPPAQDPFAAFQPQPPNNY
eukprot:CAMPEP_0184855456 /NCGR_PEP_ID=MMETSP0580-20130426/699_1 /TAXON_ID=1118495 /ORGANISM="Dactyliosolen fragilissimus" /LENGTH=374 /DNA_ID=CAMNT_0027349969 /DNA_START=167 /DNA_END=1291 /DNA_ORIENTATION=+